MKFILSILLIFSHLFSTVGICAEVHECGELVSYSFYNLNISDDSCECDHDSSDHHDDCCQSKKLEVKADKTAKNTFKTIVFKTTPVLIIIPQQVYFSAVKVNAIGQIFFNNAIDYPPGFSPPKYLLHNSFLI